MPEDIAGGSYVPDMPDVPPDNVGDFLDWLDMQGSKPQGMPPPPSRVPNVPEGRGPSGWEWQRDLHSAYLDPPPQIKGMEPYPNWRQAPIQDVRQEGLEKNYLPSLRHTPQNAAILRVLQMRTMPQPQQLDGEEGYDPAHYGPVSPLAEQAGLNDFDKRYGRGGSHFTMDPARDRYLAMIQMANHKGIPGSIPDNRVIPTKNPTAEEMVAAIYSGKEDSDPPPMPLPTPSLPPGKTLDEMIEEGAFPGDMLEEDD